MIEKKAEWGALRLQTNVHDEALGAQKLDVTMSLREATKAELAVEFGSNKDQIATSRLYERGLFGDPRAVEHVNQVLYVDVTLRTNDGSKVVMPKTELDLRLPVDSIQSLWTPSINTPCKNIRPRGILEHNTSFTTHICNLAPMGSFYSAEGLNKLAFALSDCKNIVRINIGAYEEEEAMRVTFNLFETPIPETDCYTVSLRLDTSLMPVFAALENITRYYERTELHDGADVMEVPEAAYDPVYSTWYAFLQNLDECEIEEQCAMAAEAGCKTVIVDDGWQTDDNNRGYAFCGDWQVSTRRFPHMKEHVQRVHALGMKYMVWFSVPFIGRLSKNHEAYSRYCLCFNPRWDAYVLDPRYKKVREFLVSTFANMVKEYDLDGLKLDFIDEFDMRQADEHAQDFDAERDTQSLPDAVDMLMTEVRTALQGLKQDILIEFRQNYIGPMIRKYGNMFRAHDCPNDTLMNRMTTTDVRSTCGTGEHATAVHADMFTWSPYEPVESASLQFIHTLLAVPQVSPNFKHLGVEHKQMVKHWLTFWEEHRDLLMHGTIRTQHPEFTYTVQSITKGDEEILIAGTDHILKLFDQPQVKHLTLVNGAMVEQFAVKFAAPSYDKEITVHATVYDCLGRKVGESYSLKLTTTLQELALPKSGYIKLERV